MNWPLASTAKSISLSQRYWEIDLLRGIAIIMMVTYHLMWDLWFFRILPHLVLYTGFWKYFQRTTASLFVLLVGVSLTLSYRSRQRKLGNKDKDLADEFLYFFRRGRIIFSWGMLISLVTWLAGTGAIHFGILHLIGASIILAWPFLRGRWTNLILGALLIGFDWFVGTTRVDTIWLVWLGFKPVAYAAVDYFPLIPWFGLVLIGIFLGNILYTAKGLRFPLADLSWLPLIQLLSLLGRHSLIIYLIHQPLLIGILIAFGLVVNAG